MNIKDEIFPKIKAEIRLINESTLLIETDKWDGIDRIILGDTKSRFAYIFCLENDNPNYGLDREHEG